MNELKAVYATDKDSVTSLYYPKSVVDKVLAEKDKVAAEKDEEIRRLNRALYKVCMNWANVEIKYRQLGSHVFMLDTTSEKELAWKCMADICRAKLEQYK